MKGNKGVRIRRDVLIFFFKWRVCLLFLRILIVSFFYFWEEIEIEVKGIDVVGEIIMYLVFFNKVLG